MKKNNEKNGFLIVWVSCIVVLLVFCFLGMNSKGTYSVSNCTCSVGSVYGNQCIIGGVVVGTPVCTDDDTATEDGPSTSNPTSGSNDGDTSVTCVTAAMCAGRGGSWVSEGWSKDGVACGYCMDLGGSTTEECEYKSEGHCVSVHGGGNCVRDGNCWVPKGGNDESPSSGDTSSTCITAAICAGRGENWNWVSEGWTSNGVECGYCYESDSSSDEDRCPSYNSDPNCDCVEDGTLNGKTCYSCTCYMPCVSDNPNTVCRREGDKCVCECDCEEGDDNCEPETITPATPNPNPNPNPNPDDDYVPEPEDPTPGGETSSRPSSNRPSSSRPSSGGNVTENPQTSQIAIFVVWVVAIAAICYSVYYFKKVKED